MEILRAMKPHENIVRLHYYAEQADVTDHDTRLLTLFMDYLPSNLHTLIQDHATGIPLELIRVYSKQLLSGLAHLASQNIVHRDLVPRNILIDPERKILKLADFGCAKVVNPELLNHPHVGVWQYRGVELLFGATRYSSQAGTYLCISRLRLDVWSAGVVILEMMSGKFPFAARSEEVMLASILTILGPITMEQVRDMGVDPMLFPELLMGSTFHARRWSDVQVFPQTPSVELRSMLNLMLEYSPRRRNNAAKLLDHEFFKGDN
jgi:serine/threonine protein kinase